MSVSIDELLAPTLADVGVIRSFVFGFAVLNIAYCLIYAVEFVGGLASVSTARTAAVVVYFTGCAVGFFIAGRGSSRTADSIITEQRSEIGRKLRMEEMMRRLRSEEDIMKKKVELADADNSGAAPAYLITTDQRKKMSISVHVAPSMPSRPCRFCLSLQADSVFADFDVDEEGRAFLRRISFDGYGCCGGEFRKMRLEDSRLLIRSVDQGAVDDPRIGAVLRAYFAENADVIWSDALTSHELL